MATSDSEDFESADEDVDTNVGKHDKLDDNATDECGDNIRNKNKDELQKNDSGGGDLCRSLDDGDINVLKQECSEDVEKKIMNLSSNAVAEEKPKNKTAKEHSRRQQKPRETKSGSVIKKLGTKLSSTNSIFSKKTESQEKVDTQDNNSDSGKEEINASVKSGNLDEGIEKLSVQEKKDDDIAPVLDKMCEATTGKVSFTLEVCHSVKTL